MSYISEFTTDIRHVKGGDNEVADALSRNPVNAINAIMPTLQVDFPALAAAQREDDELKHLLTATTALNLEWIPIPGSEDKVCCDTSVSRTRPFVPASLRRHVFESLHRLPHAGIRPTQRLVTARFVWPGVNRDVRRWAREWVACQRSKIQRHTSTALGTLPTPDSRFDHVHLDIVGPLPPCHGKVYLLTCVDRFTCWAEAIPIADITAETVASAFLYHRVARFGVPSTITTDRGRQFESALFTAISQLMGTSRIRTTAYHPMSNGMVERFHHQLKAALTATEEHNWVEALPLILLGIRSTLKEDIGCSAAELVYATTLRLPGEFFARGSEEASIACSDYALRLRNVMSKMRVVPPRPPGSRVVHVDPQLTSCPYVFVRHDAVRRPLQPPYDGPFKVLRRGNKQFTIKRSGREEVASLDRIKPAHMDRDDAVLPPLRESSPGPPSLSADAQRTAIKSTHSPGPLTPFGNSLRGECCGGSQAKPSQTARQRHVEHGLRLVMERLEALGNGLLVVVHAATRLASLQESSLHRLVLHLEVHEVRALAHLGFETLPLLDIPGIAVDEESLGFLEVFLDCLLNQLKDHCQRGKLSLLHDFVDFLAPIAARLHFSPQ